MRVYSASNVTTILNKEYGPAAASALVDAYGGRRIWVPKNVTGKLLDRLGAEITAVLVRYYAGCGVDVPSRQGEERIQKSLRLKHDILTSDLSANELAARHGVSSVWVRRLRAQICDAPSIQPVKD
ncbi:MAG: hypothetical protein ACK5LJ_07710 [Paracoccus sp. (in: a-proteobacteria)]